MVWKTGTQTTSTFLKAKMYIGTQCVTEAHWEQEQFKFLHLVQTSSLNLYHYTRSPKAPLTSWSVFLRISQNHRMVAVGRDLWRSSSPTHPSQSRVTYSRLHRTSSRLVLNISWEGDQRIRNLSLIWKNKRAGILYIHKNKPPHYSPYVSSFVIPNPD